MKGTKGRYRGRNRYRRSASSRWVDEDQKEQLMDEIELLDGASAEFDQELVSKGDLPRYASDLL